MKLPRDAFLREAVEWAREIRGIMDDESRRLAPLYNDPALDATPRVRDAIAIRSERARMVAWACNVFLCGLGVDDQAEEQ